MEILAHFDSLEEFKEAYDDLGYSSRESEKNGLTPAERKRLIFVKRLQKKELVFPPDFPPEEGFFFFFFFLFNLSLILILFVFYFLISG